MWFVRARRGVVCKGMVSMHMCMHIIGLIAGCI